MRGPDLVDVRLLWRAAARGDGPRERRDRLIIAMLFDLGLRRGECCALELADVEAGADGRPAAVWILSFRTLVRTLIKTVPSSLWGTIMFESGAGLLAKQKSPGKKSGQVFGKQQPIVAQVRGSAQRKEWLEALAKANRQSVSGLIDTALARLAREIGFREPPER
jgi:integrase